MYLSHFGLDDPPFTITPDTSYFFAHASYQDALNTLLLAVRGGEGFIKVVGEVGTGKTLLCRKFLAALGEECATAYIPNPYLEPMTLLMAIADELEIDYPEAVNQHQLLSRLTARLIDSFAADGRRVVVCLDEAQAMPVETLETLRLLSNLETERRKLLQVVLFGQPELDARLSDPAIRQLRQRIAFSCRLQPLARDEIAYYLAHRLSIAGYRGGPLFTRGAVRRLWAASRGVPRLVNVLAHKAMLSAYGEGAARIEPRHLRLAVDDTESVRGAGRWQLPLRLGVATVLGAAVVAGVAVWGLVA